MDGGVYFLESSCRGPDRLLGKGFLWGEKSLMEKRRRVHLVAGSSE